MLLENTVFQYSPTDGSENKSIRIVAFSNYYVHYVSLIGRCALPQVNSITEIEKMINSGFLQEIDDPFALAFDEAAIPEKYKTIRDSRYKIVDYIWNENRIQFLQKTTRGALLRETAKKFNVSLTHVKNIITIFLQWGMTKNTLLPNYLNCGGRGVIKGLTDKKRGRPPRPDVNGNAVERGNVTPEIADKIEKAIRLFYRKDCRRTLTETYYCMLESMFSDKCVIDNQVKKIVWESSRIPSMNQFRYWYKKTTDFREDYISRYSKREFDLKERELLGDTSLEAFGPGSKFQIDATVADVYLVSINNRSRLIGRPVIYDVVDVYSRKIAGIYVGLEGPSWLGAMMALINVITNKKDFCAQYGIHIDEDEWPCCQLPEAILADRGEFMGYNPEGLINNLGVRVENTPSGRGDLKGIVERDFGAINERIWHQTPGAILKEYRERDRRDRSLDAILDIKQFTACIISSVLELNKRVIRGYPRELGMMRDEVLPIPVEMWKWGLENRKGRLKKIDSEIVKLNLLYKDTANVNKQGINYRGRHYSSEVAIKEQWFVGKKIKKVDIRYDPRNMNYIYIPLDNGQRFIKCFRLDRDYMYDDMFLEEIVFQQELATELIAEQRNEENQTIVDRISTTKEIIEKAKAQKVFSPESKTSRRKNTKQNRQEEKEMLRQEESIELGKPLNRHQGTVIDIKSKEKLDLANPLLDMIKAVVKGEKNEK